MKTKNIRLAVGILIVLSVIGRSGWAQAAEREAFEARMYSIETVSHFGVSDEKFAALTDVQRKSLVEARDDLMGMLQAIQDRHDVTRYVTPQMARKYKTSADLAASLIGPETSILAAGISDFVLVDKGTIRLSFFAIVSSEGDIVVSEKAAVLKETDLGWRFAGFE